MRRTLILAAALLAAGCGPATDDGTEPFLATRVAEPQHAELDWRESYPATGKRLVFEVHELDVTADGWRARISVTNSTAIPFETGLRPEELTYGLMLFATDDLEELERASRNGRVPPVRKAAHIEPTPPDVLRPGATWRATLSAPGALADGSWVRVAFGPLRAQGEPPEQMQPVVVWITDRTHRL